MFAKKGQEITPWSIYNNNNNILVERVEINNEKRYAS